MNIPKIAIKNYHFTLVVFLMITLFGVSSYLNMPKSEDPYTEFHTTTILVINPGSTPEDMETLIVNPIEETLNEIDGVKNITTSIQNGVSFSFVEFLIGEDYDKKHQEVIQKVNEVRDDLPSTIYNIDIAQPSVLNVAIYQMAFVSTGASAYEMKKSAEDLKKKLEKVGGVRKVDLHAEQELEVQVKCDLERLASYNLSLNRLIAILQSENLSIPGGSIDLGNKKFNIQTSGLYKSINEIKQTVINAGENGIVLLGDVAEVSFGYKNPDIKARYNGREALWLTIEQKKGINIYKVSERIDEIVAEFVKDVPESIQVETVMRQADGVQKRVNGFFMNFLQGILLVGAIILFALGVRSALIVMIAIPVSVFAGIGLIDLAGYGIQQMSIAGLIIALGMLVDNSIAIVENIYRYINKGLKPIDAAVKGASKIGNALVSSTLTTVLAFAPMLLMANDVGNFIRSMVLIVIFSLIASLVVALCLTPFVASRMLKKSNKEPKQGMLNRFIEKYYSRWLNGALNRPKLIVVSSVIIFFGSLSLMPLIGVSFFPKADKSQLMVNVAGIQGTNLKNTEEALVYVEGVLENIPEVEKIASTAGEGNPQVYYNMLKPNPSTNSGQAYAILSEVKPERMNEIVAELRMVFATYPAAKIEVKEFIQGPPVDAPVQIRLFSENLEDLKIAAGQVEDVFNEVSGIININNPFSVDKTDLHVKIDREKAGRLGVSLIDIDRMVRTAVNGLQVSSYQDKLGDKYNIVIKSKDDNSSDLSWIEKVYVPTAIGSQIKLSQVADIQMVKGIKRIDHYDFDRYVSILADVDEGIQSIDKATKDVIAKLNNTELAGSVVYSVGGEQESRDESFGGLGTSLLIALLGIFAVLVLQFSSFKQPLIIFTAIPLSITGSFITLLITGHSFSFMAFVGLTSLMGIVINSSIILVDYANQLIKEGMKVRAAVFEASKTRFTPILLTTVTTVGGLLPLTLFGGTMWAPMGWAIIGGLIFSTLLTLILVPVLYQSLSNDVKELEHR
ncbi:MAG: efflux RND transporter permease subunit [Salinivirgaceae bacterium]|jgi:multidrug efflux pump subunit AcrB|nr:efflux RND transporter permease subunit [Salinivirgaceae bacterium]